MLFLASVLEQTGADLESLEWYKKCVELQPQNALAYSNAANILIGLGRNSDAVAMALRAVRADGKYIDGLLALAIAYQGIHEEHKAMEQLQRALEVDPRSEKVPSSTLCLRHNHTSWS